MTDDQMKWRFPDSWSVTQSNGENVRVELSQDGNTLTGTAHGSSRDRPAETTGIMTGSIEGDSINFTVYWPDETVAEYSGTVDGAGKAEGTTVDRSDDVPPTNWFGEPALLAWE